MISVPFLRNPSRARRLLVAALLCLAASSPAADLYFEVGSTRSPDLDDRLDAAVRDFAQRTSQLSARQRSAWALARSETVFSLPVRVILTQNGVPLPVRTQTRAPGADLVPTFDASGSRAFPTTYKTLLQNVFTAARPAMNAIFGSPAVGGTVNVKNFDADIQDRLAVAGGYYVPNAPGGPEIRFPIYLNEVSAGINYIHTLLLAYAGPNVYPFDAFSEGLVRAGTMTVARSPGSLPNNPDADLVEATLANLYDVSEFYDWYNQPALGGPKFIAQNLLNTQLPAGGNTGGIFLLRYQMAGTAWQKVVAEYPGFLAEFNARFYASPGAYQISADLVVLGQEVLDFLAGSAGATVEGLSFANWFERQAILDTRLTAGVKTLVQPFPLAPQTGSSDFGAFALVLNAFRTSTTGDETLLSGASYPIYWRSDFTRLVLSADDDKISVSGAFGAVSPNFPSDANQGEIYRATVDVPFQAKTARAYLPAGAISTGQNLNPNTFYGTVVGLEPVAGATYSVTVEWVGGSQALIPVRNFAFGHRITDSTFEKAQAMTVRVFRTAASTTTEVITRRVNKGFGAIGLDLRPDTAAVQFPLALGARLAMVGAPLEPYRPQAADLLGLADNQTLVARWNPIVARYDLFPDEGDWRQGLGYFVRPSAAINPTIRGSTSPHTPISVALRPGWNMITPPISSSINVSALEVTFAASSISTYNEAIGDTLGTTIFRFEPNVGNPDGGTLVPATTLEPGQAYFVRALRPEGAVLIFTPSTFTAGATSVTTSARGRREPLGLPGYLGRLGTLRTAENRWEVKVEMREAGGGKSHVLVGQSDRASGKFDPRIDSDLPPGPGGVQISVEGEAAMYRDVRRMGLADAWTLRAAGLTPGRLYSLKFTPQPGFRRMELEDLTLGRSRDVYSGMRYDFVAESSVHRFVLRVGGAR